MTPEYFATVRPTYLESWPAALRALSLRQVAVPLTREETEVLFQRAVAPPTGWSSGAVPPGLERVAQALEEALAQFPAGAMVRLGSRSAKDSRYALHRGLRVDGAAGALAMLTSGSERVAFDLRLALRHGYLPQLFVREWLHLPAWAELRCFMRGRRLVGISQYDCRGLGFSEELHANAPRLRVAVEAFFETFREACHLEDVVFDVFAVTPLPDGNAPPAIRLLELNPFFPKTDAGLFSWEHGGDFDGSFRIVGEGLGNPLRRAK
ncbi:hypothetical protein HPC49_39340 [Pyxidicoccus fallax]|uniref:Cell division cycle protein 123 n=1 Tax=Pyxidicoccus fallax TaxID=394095 RepID=A0A848LJ80_9BACT|nr:hypothetical protein [Pyxidicoccus fallax]NMO17779.1 hypothetical protein [Pyxidicoccus fallax]NPC84256.1 hypothetical protein [Pyxidicoccus fallax]